MPNKTALYTVISNDYDTPKPISLRGVDCFMFTDDPTINCQGWQTVLIEKTNDQRLQRKLKILGHPTLKNYDITVYIDANMTINNRFSSLISQFKGGIAMGNHKRRCVYDEGLAVKKLKKAPSEIVNKQIAEYYENDFPANFGMWSAGVIIRDNKDEKIKEMCELWHKKLSEHSHRDQLSLPWALYHTGIKPKEFRVSQYVKIHKHKMKEPPKVFYSTPWSSQKNIGGANNEFISLLPDNAWICITDADSQFMLPDWGKQIEDIILKNGNNFDLIGCVTNRLGGLHQCYDNKFSEDFDAINHYEIAKELHEKYYDEVEETSGVAGLCMIFSKSTWRKVGGFVENNITADTLFNKSVKKKSGKIGLAKGLYRFHSYRIWEAGNGRSKAQHSIKHLK